MRVEAVKFKRCNDGIEQLVDTGTARVKHIMGNLSVQRVARIKKIFQALQGVTHLKQWPLHVVLQPPKNFFG